MRYTYTLVVVVAFGFGMSCRVSEPDPLRLAAPVVPDCVGDQPISRFRGNAADSDDSAQWLVPLYSALLAAADEGPLWCGGSRNLESYRILSLPSDRSAVVVRAESSSSGWRLVANVFDQVPAPLSIQADAPRIVDQKTLNVTQETIRPFLDAIAKADFWTAPAYRSSDAVDDGRVWTIEGRREGRYRAVSRSNVDETFAEAAIRLLKLSGIDKHSSLSKAR